MRQYWKTPLMGSLLRYATGRSILKSVPLLLAIFLMERAKELQLGTNESDYLLVPGVRVFVERCNVLLRSLGQSEHWLLLWESPSEACRLHYNDNNDSVWSSQDYWWIPMTENNIDRKKFPGRPNVRVGAISGNTWKCSHFQAAVCLADSSRLSPAPRSTGGADNQPHAAQPWPHVGHLSCW